MRCPKCNSAKMNVTNTYAVNETVKTQRWACGDCGAKIVTKVVTTVEAINPRRGQGASTLAERLRRSSIIKPPSEASSGGV